VETAAGLDRAGCRQWFEQHHSIEAFGGRIEDWLQEVIQGAAAPPLDAPG
jgi:hypothetical protein